jgi:anti-sigma regulatory factor (Ser/Thr protein kinase)
VLPLVDAVQHIAEHRWRILTELLGHAVTARRPEEVCSRAIDSLAALAGELIYAGVYVAECDGGWRSMCATPGFPFGGDWPLSEAARAGGPLPLEGRSGLLVPLQSSVTTPALGVLVVGLGAGVSADEELLRFWARVGQHLGTALAIAGIRGQAEKHEQIVALQDHALQTFFVIGLLARAALVELEPDHVNETVATALVQIMDVATAGREHLREAIFALGHAEIGESGVIDGLHALARAFQRRTGIDAEVLVTGDPRLIPVETIETLHHTAAEALANIEQHSQAGAVVLSLQVARRSVTLSVQDDGVGLTNPDLERIASSTTHFGLRGVGMRVRRLGGTFVARPARDGGFVVRTRLPLRTR